MPVEELAEGCATVAVLRFFFRRQFGEGFLNGRKIKQRVIPESTRAPGRIEQQALRLAAKYIKDLPVAGDGDHAHEPGGALFGRNLSEFPNQAGIIGLVVGVISHQMRLVSGIARGVNSGSAAQRVHLKAGIVRQNNFARGECAVVFSFFAGVGLEGETILDCGGNGSEIGQRLDRDSQRSCGARRNREVCLGSRWR